MTFEGSYIELLLGAEELSSLFHAGFDESSVDSLGYDLRLGERIEHVTTGASKDLVQNEDVIIYPGETVIVKTEEILHLPDEVYALGSPKMSLLIKGLWAHGGKTDFGFNSCLTLGFQNVGSNPITIKRCMPIFHLSFYKVHNKETTEYAGSGPIFPARNTSILDGDNFVPKHKIDEIKQNDGIKSYRLMKQLYYIDKKITITYYLPYIALLAIFLGQILPSFGIISEFIADRIVLVSLLVGIVSGVLQIGKMLRDWYKKRQENE